VHCGGDVTGRWKVEHVCDSPDSLRREEVCSMDGLVETSEATHHGLIGFYEFHADGSTAMEWQSAWRRTLTTPVSCVNLSCELYEQSLVKHMPDLRSEASCERIEESCACEVSTWLHLVSSETYSISGSTLRFSGRSDIEFGFCVEGDRFTLQEPQSGYVFVRE